MSAPNLSLHSVLDRLAEGPWRLNGLPTIGGSGLYFVALELGAAPTYAWFSLSKNLSAARTSFFDRDEAFAFLTEYAKDGYDESLFDVSRHVPDGAAARRPPARHRPHGPPETGARRAAPRPHGEPVGSGRTRHLQCRRC